MAELSRSYRYRLAPTAEQRRALGKAAAARRFVFNWGLERRISTYRASARTLTLGELERELVALKRTDEGRWLTDADSQSLQQALRDLDDAFRRFFRGDSRFPRFKSRKRDLDRFRIPQRCRLCGDCVRVPKIGLIRVRLSRPLDGRPGAATFKRDAAGYWYVTFVVHLSINPSGQMSGRKVGIDLGIRHLATLSNGESVASPGFEQRASRRLRRMHRALTRARRGSKGRAKRRRALALEYARVARRRHDFLHKLTTGWVHEFDLICVEDLNVSGLARTKLSRQVRDAGFRELRRQLTYKCETGSCELHAVDRFFPSSKTCSDCGRVRAGFSSRAKTWRCGCGCELDRDLNAARNLLREGLRIRAAAGDADAINACEVSARPRIGAADAEAGTRSQGSQE